MERGQYEAKQTNDLPQQTCSYAFGPLQQRSGGSLSRKVRRKSKHPQIYSSVLADLPIYHSEPVLRLSAGAAIDNFIAGLVSSLLWQIPWGQHLTAYATERGKWLTALSVNLPCMT